ncbi:vacuolar sorting-associated 24-like protein 1-like [Micractinium conductrix]|uniref:Vacuolar sorting-associated 24-like protein 1-like n=1 Tax=Micractinium conductrix TaxID=554055 RepID=A0A2P6VAN9_9CHLO|nr:vacuolar sorting-associated 24-like protein 1-like [Micractinium conductrix]|eukprot:PSC71154.1 vacuolar sorting-associated 24-like protein 1-like [Micractinium conductrix]
MISEKGLQATLANVFRKQEDPKELVRKWQRSIRGEIRGVERQMMDIQREQKKAEKLIKEAAKRNDMASCKIIAKEVVNMRRTITKLAVNKATFLSLSNQMTEQLAMTRVAGALGKSGEVMKLVNNLMRVPALQKTMVEMSREMMKAGIIDEMMTDAMESAFGDDELEEETEEEVDKILLEVAGETLSQMAAAPRQQKQAVRQQAQAATEEEEDLAARLAAVRS